MVGRRGEAPLVPPYIRPSLKKALALGIQEAWLRKVGAVLIVPALVPAPEALTRLGSPLAGRRAFARSGHF